MFHHSLIRPFLTLSLSLSSFVLFSIQKNADAAEDQGRAGKKQKKKGGAAGGAALPLPAAQRQRIAKMFSAAAAGGSSSSVSAAAAGAGAGRGGKQAAAAAAAADPAAGDALLDDILGDIDEPSSTKPKAGTRKAAASAVPVAFAAPPRASAAALRAASLAKVEAAEPAAVEVEEEEEEEEPAAAAAEGVEAEEPEAAPAAARAAAALHPAAARIKAEAGASKPKAAAAAPLGTPAAAAKTTGGASSPSAVVTPYRTPAPAVPASAEDPLLETPATGAPAAGWAAQYDDLGAEVVADGEGEEAPAAASAPSSPSVALAAAPLSDDAPLPLEKDGSLPFFLLDAHEEWATPGVVYLFGKVPLPSAPAAPAAPAGSAAAASGSSSPAAAAAGNGAPQRFVSCCAVVRNAHRSVVFVPREPLFGADEEGAAEIDALEHELASAVAEGGEAGAARERTARPALLRALHAAASDLKAEVRALLSSHGVKSFSLKPVRRSYPGVGAPPAAARGVAAAMGWGNAGAAAGGWAIKARFPAACPLLPVGLSGAHFAATFGGNQSALEALLVKRRVRGAVWLRLGGGAAGGGAGGAPAAPPAPPLRRVAAAQQVSWCALEVELAAGPKAVSPAPDDGWGSRPPPPLTVAAVKVTAAAAPAGGKSAGGANEILALSVVHLRDSVPCDRPLSRAAWSPPSPSSGPSSLSTLRSFTILRRVEPGKPFPPGLDAAVARANAAAAAAAQQQRRRGGAGAAAPADDEADGPALSALPTEKALLSAALARLRALDADVLLGHNAAAFDLELVLHRALQLGVPQWSRLGRLRRTKPPRASSGGSGGGGGSGGPGGGGASPQLVTALAGRLLCDTYLSSRELVREVDYTLTTMARSLLGQARSELPPAAVRAAFDDPRGGAAKLLGAARHAEGDAWLALGLAATLNVLPLTRALACLSGSLWSRALLGQRAGRIEMLLLHELRARKMLLPDRWSARDRERLLSEAGGGGAGAATKGPQYSGGLVLEPKKGLYESFVLLLDFNSLYPSIIQEYNLCWTTVDCSPAVAGGGGGGKAPSSPAAVLPPPPASEADLAVLPTVIRGLVARRRAVKDLLRSERDPTRRAQLDLRQQALKLTANSMYGCLGFSASRFHARDLAELVTSQGREVLQATVDLVRAGVGADVVYGDTDSIMVSAGAADLPSALQLGARIKREVNRRYRTLEIELDGVYSRMLLLKKKKYAAVKVEPGKVAADGVSPVLTREAKGLDIVRRDWCPLAKDAGSRALDAILGGGGGGGGGGSGSGGSAGGESAPPSDDVVGAIHDALRDVAAKCAAAQVPLHKFVITKQLTRRPEDYPDASNQPHVQVALRRKAKGDARDATQQGETVPYIICVDGPGVVGEGEKPESAAAAAAEDADGPAAPPPPPLLAGLPLASRAFHPDEVRASAGRLAVDLEYYLGNQVLPVVSRLCAPIEGACDAGQLAECLGLDSAKYKSSSAGAGGGPSHYGGSLAAAAREAAMLGGGPWLDDDARFESCPKLLLRAPDSGSASRRVFAFVGAEAVASGEVEAERALEIPSSSSSSAGNPPPHRLTAAQLANAAALACRRVFREYYDAPAVSDDELAPAATRDACLRVSSSSAASSAAPSGDLPADPTSSARMHRALPEAEAYARLSALWRSLDPARAAAAAERKAEAAAAKGGAPPAVAGEAALRLGPIARELQAAADVAAKARDAAAYRWVNVASLFAC